MTQLRTKLMGQATCSRRLAQSILGWNLSHATDLPRCRVSRSIAGQYSAGTAPRDRHMLTVLGLTGSSAVLMAEANAAIVPPQTSMASSSACIGRFRVSSMARSRAVVTHDRESKALTNVTQLSAPITPVNSIGERLASARADLEMNQAAVAAKAGVSPGTIGNIEAGTRKNPRALLAIARAVRVHPEWLKEGTGPRYTPGHPKFKGQASDLGVAQRLSQPISETGLTGTKYTRLKVREWVKAGAGGEIETAPQAKGVDLGHVDLDFPIELGAYALRVRGDGLHPVADDGTVLLIYPNTECRPRQRILVTMRNGRRFCGKLVELADDAVHATELTTRTPRTFDRGQVESVEWIRDILDVGVWSAEAEEQQRGKEIRDSVAAPPPAAKRIAR